MAVFYQFDTNTGEARTIDLQPGQVLAPATVDNGIYMIPEAGLEVILSRIKASFDPREGETPAQARSRASDVLTGLADVPAAVTQIGFRLMGDGE